MTLSTRTDALTATSQQAVVYQIHPLTGGAQKHYATFRSKQKTVLGLTVDPSEGTVANRLIETLSIAFDSSVNSIPTDYLVLTRTLPSEFTRMNGLG